MLNSDFYKNLFDAEKIKKSSYLYMLFKDVKVFSNKTKTLIELIFAYAPKETSSYIRCIADYVKSIAITAHFGLKLFPEKVLTIIGRYSPIEMQKLLKSTNTQFPFHKFYCDDLYVLEQNSDYGIIPAQFANNVDGIRDFIDYDAIVIYNYDNKENKKHLFPLTQSLGIEFKNRIIDLVIVNKNNVVTIPRGLTRNILRSFNKTPEEQKSIDCYFWATACMDYDLKVYSNMRPIQVMEEIKPFSIFWITDKTKQERFHVCIYLGNNLFLEKIGVSSAFNITTLEKLKIATNIKTKNMNLAIEEPIVGCSLKTCKKHLKHTFDEIVSTKEVVKTFILGVTRKVKEHTYATKPVTVKRCSVCKRAQYCSVECQRSDYPEHKKNCKPPITINDPVVQDAIKRKKDLWNKTMKPQIESNPNAVIVS